MRVFVSEFLVGGAFSKTAASPSMRREGHAMLQAVTADIARLPDWTSVTTLESGFSADLAAEVIRVSDAAHELEVFDRLIHQVDAVLVIAPETDGILARRCRQVKNANVDSWNCSPESIELCSDKLRLANHLQSHGLPTIPTTLIDFNRFSQGSVRPHVLKPRDGAGSTLTFLVATHSDWQNVALIYRRAGIENQCISQPFVPGRNLSIGVNISLDGRGIACLEVAEQKISSDGRFQYLGGRLPASISKSAHDAIVRMILDTCPKIPGLAGYIGFDVLLPDHGDPLIVEINPRLTTSYVGYRHLYATPLPQYWLSPCELQSRKNGSIDWDLSSIWRENS